jgi:hypothetical protein
LAVDRRFFPTIVVWLTSESGIAWTLGSIDSDVEAEPAEMPTAQQTETIATAAVAAATR